MLDNNNIHRMDLTGPDLTIALSSAMDTTFLSFAPPFFPPCLSFVHPFD
jgi:hypothetical protein